METPEWHKERDKLRSRFAKGDITSATRKELEWHLVVIANSHSNPGGYSAQQETHKGETAAFTTLIRHLLVVKVAEELHARSHKISVWALWLAGGSMVVALVAAVFAGLLVWVEGQKVHSKNGESPNTIRQTPARTLPPQSSPTAKPPGPAGQTPSLSWSTNSTPAASPVSTK